MTYQKPELSVLGDAEVAILGTQKVLIDPPDADNLPTDGSYEVDE